MHNKTKKPLDSMWKMIYNKITKTFKGHKGS